MEIISACAYANIWLEHMIICSMW